MSAHTSTAGTSPLRILVAKPGLDGHDRGAKIVARALRDAGMEVIYTGLRQTADMIVSAALQEDVDAVGLSVLSGSHRQHFRAVRAGLDAAGATDVLLFGGGIVPSRDLPELEAIGVGRIFGPGTPTSEIVAYLQERVTGGSTGTDPHESASEGAAPAGS